MANKKTTRDQMRRKFEQANGNLSTAQGYLAEFIETYTDYHPDLAAQALLISEALEEMKNAIETLRGSF